LTTPGSSFEFTGTDRFSLRRRIGAGGMGIVYEVHDRDSDTRVALKTLRNLDPQSLYRLKQEFRALQDLQHPNLVTLGELIEDGGRWFFTMELVPGDDFLSYVRPGDALASGSRLTMPALRVTVPEIERPAARKPASFDEARLRDAFAQLALGLRALHRAGKVHRDIKPSNIQVTDGGRAVLLDFGLLVDTRGELESTEQHVVGTAAYMAPEQAASKPVGPEADWYSAGVLLYEALTGEVPFEGSALAVLMNKQQREPAPPSQTTDGVPEDLDALCVALLKFDPAARPDADGVLRMLGADETDGRLIEVQRQAASSSQAGTPPFVGRTEELELLARAHDRTRRGEAATVLVRGESGVGKSALIREFLDGPDWGDQPVVRLRGRCYERESVPFKGLDGVVDSLSRLLRRLPRAETAALMPRNAAMLPTMFPVLGRVEHIAGAPRPPQEIRDPHEVRNRVFGALRELLTRLAERYPLVVVIDDLQWADADSLLLLGDLTRPPDPPPMLLIASARRSPPELAAALSEPLTDIRLDRLAPDDARELATLLLGRRGGVSRGAAEAIADEAGGHPMFIDELVRHVTDSGERARGALRLDDAIVERIDRLDARAIRLLKIIALAGAPIAQAVVCQAAEIPMADATRHLQLLRVANLVRAAMSRGTDRLEPYHDRIREALIGRLSDDERRDRHARLAIALEAAEQPIRHPEMLVSHLEAAGRIEEATQRAEQAARRARKGLAFDRAAELYRTALRLGDYDDDKRRQLLMRLGESLASAGRGFESATAYLEAAEGVGAERLECQRRAAEQLLISGHIAEGLEALEAVLAEIGEKLPKTPQRALASLLWSRAKLRLRGIEFTERHESEIPPRELTRLDVYKSVAHGLGVVDTIRGVDFQSRGLLLALRTGEPLRVGRALLEGGAYLAVQGGRSIGRARVLIRRATQIAEERGDPYLLALAPAVDGLASYYEGRLRIAVDKLRKSETRFVENTLGAGWELNTVRLFRLFVLRRLGGFDELGRCFADYVRDAVRRGDRHMETSVRWSCNDVWLARDDDAQAQADLDDTPWVPPEGRFHLQHYYQLRARAELDLYRGGAAGALARLDSGFRGLRRSMLLRVQDIRAETNFTIGRCALAAGDGDHADRVAKALRKDDVCYSIVWSQLVAAGAHLVRGNDDAARRKLRDAIQAAEDSDMAMCAAAARRQYGTLLGGEEGNRYISEADEFMTKEGIVSPGRMTQLLLGVTMAP
jgi:serine/threonine protein kinase